PPHLRAFATFTDIIANIARNKTVKTTPAPQCPLVKLVQDLFLGNRQKAFNYRPVSPVLGVSDKISNDRINNRIESFTDSGIIDVLSRGKDKYNPGLVAEKYQHTIVEGKVDMKQPGNAYVISKELDADVYIAPNNTGNALHNATGRVRLFPMRKNHKLEG